MTVFELIKRWLKLSEFTGMRFKCNRSGVSARGGKDWGALSPWCTWHSEKKTALTRSWNGWHLALALLPLEPGKEKLLLFEHPVYCILDFPDGSVIKNAPYSTGEVPSLGREDPLEKAMATHSSVLAWEIQCTEELGGLQSTGSQRVGHNLGINNNHSILLQQSRQNETDQIPHWKGDLFFS